MTNPDLRETIRALAPNADPDEMLNREVLLVQRVEPEVGLLVAADGTRVRQIILRLFGIQLPDLRPVEVDVAMPMLFAAQLGTTLVAHLLDEVAVTEEEVLTEPVAAVPSQKIPSPYM